MVQVRRHTCAVTFAQSGFVPLPGVLTSPGAAAPGPSRRRAGPLSPPDPPIGASLRSKTAAFGAPEARVRGSGGVAPPEQSGDLGAAGKAESRKLVRAGVVAQAVVYDEDGSDCPMETGARAGCALAKRWWPTRPWSQQYLAQETNASLAQSEILWCEFE
eukprot:14802933-Alexandrium_andersonii.AAC.1